jgi:hypothetical protein
MRPRILGSVSALVSAATIVVGANVRTTGKLISDAANGPPLEVASSEQVANLNADMVDGLDAADLVTHQQLDVTLDTLAMRQLRFSAGGEFTVPAGVDLLEVTAIGGGGGGGGGGTLSVEAAGGGGGGGYVVHTYVVVAPGEEIAITIGSGGLGGAHNFTGTAGGETVVHSASASWRVVALGGQGGQGVAPGAPFDGGKGGDGYFGGGGGGGGLIGDPVPGSGGVGVLGNGEDGQGDSGGQGASGGQVAADGGGGGGPGGGTGGQQPESLSGGPGSQAGAGGGGGDNGFGGNGADGSVVLRWVGPASA